MTYKVKEIFKTLQGEGARTGTTAVFLRFAGCNLWSGREKDRSKAVCRFCDTDFLGGTKYRDSTILAEAVAECWGYKHREHRFVVITGGEPLLQFDSGLRKALHRHGFYVAIETNGTIEVPGGIDWLTVSPKAGAPIVVEVADEVKLVYPQNGLAPEDVDRGIIASHYFLQPMDGPDRDENTRKVIAYCGAHPKWRISLQTHKMMGIP
jgi:7-carboxy-7-deazaguanine synthase